MLKYWLDNSSCSLSLVQTMVALHYVSKGFTMVTGDAEDTGAAFSLTSNDVFENNRAQTLYHTLTHKPNFYLF